MPTAAEAAQPPQAKAGGLRTWSDKTGRFKVTAELVAVEGDKVRLRREGGALLLVPLAKLSDDDHRYLRDLPKP